MMLDEQQKFSWPGLSAEVASLCEQLGLEDATQTKMSKVKYKKEVEKACKMMDETSMKKEMEHMKDKKMKVMIKEGCEMKDYVKEGNIYAARKVWEAKCYMLSVAGNYPGHKRYEATSWRCQACPYMVREDQDHLSQCSGYADLRSGIDFSSDKELVKFFALVMKRREDRGWD